MKHGGGTYVWASVESRGSALNVTHFCPQRDWGKREKSDRYVIIIIIYPPTATVVGAPQMISQPVFSIFSLFSTATWHLPHSRPVHSLMLSSHLFLCPPCLLLIFTVPCQMGLARPMNGKHDHTTAVCVSLRFSGGLRVVQLLAGSWHGLPRW